MPSALWSLCVALSSRHQDRLRRVQERYPGFSELEVFVRKAVDWMRVYESSQGRVQPLVFGMGEALHEIEVGNTLLIEALKESIPPVDRAEAYNQLRRAAARAKSALGLVRVEDGWQRGL